MYSVVESVFFEGEVVTVVGTGTAEFVSAGGDATSTNIYTPKEVFVDSSLNIYFVEYNAHAIRKDTASTNILSIIAGNGSLEYTNQVPLSGSIAATGGRSNR